MIVFHDDKIKKRFHLLKVNKTNGFMSIPTKKMKNISPVFSVDKEYTLLFYVLFL